MLEPIPEEQSVHGDHSLSSTRQVGRWKRRSRSTKPKPGTLMNNFNMSDRSSQLEQLLEFPTGIVIPTTRWETMMEVPKALVRCRMRLEIALVFYHKHGLRRRMMLSLWSISRTRLGFGFVLARGPRRDRKDYATQYRRMLVAFSNKLRKFNVHIDIMTDSETAVSTISGSDNGIVPDIVDVNSLPDVVAIANGLEGLQSVGESDDAGHSLQ